MIAHLRHYILYSTLVHGALLMAVCSLLRAPIPHGLDTPGVLVADLVIAAPKTAHTDGPLEEAVHHPTVETVDKAGSPHGNRAVPALSSFSLPDPSVGLRTMHYIKSGRMTVTSLLSRSLDSLAIEGLTGQTAVVELHYNGTRHLKSLAIMPSDESSRQLADLLQSHVTWESVPAPAEYSLPYRVLKLKVRISDKQFAVALEPA
jgi:hypothetical protein